MNEHALAVLAFPDVLDLVAQRASSELGAARVRTLSPSTGRAWIRAEHGRVAAMRTLVAGDDGWRPEPIPDIGQPLSRLRVAGSRWSAAELLGGAQLLRSSRLTRQALTDERRDAAATAVLAPFISRLVAARDEEAAIEHAIDDEAQVKDDASPALRRVRRSLRSAEGELVQLLEREMRRLDARYRVPDMSVTVRNGRYVMPVRREARAVVGGIVHDESSTGGTLFVEPPAAVAAGNRIRELEAEEVREVERILHELTDRVRPLHAGLLEALEAMVELDALYARARYADEFRCANATVVDAGEGFAIREGRHPRLLAQGEPVVPFDLEMRADERTLLVSGPNTGGKTVLLTAVGLITLMTQAGIPAPVGSTSRIAVIEDVFADIGDEQSIEASLSTFSAHVRNLGEILDRATARSLVLVDELGSGTDPTEGAALGAALLEELTQRGALTIATTHLGALKLLPTEVPGVVNASLQFDEVALEPTYRLIKGIPGRSYGLRIARRLQLPPAVLDRAEERLPQGERDLAALLAAVEARAAAIQQREAASQEEAERLERRLERASAREAALREAERALERQSRQEARRYVLDARAEVERVIRSLRTGEAPSAEQEREARRQVEEMALEHSTALERLMARERRPERARPRATRLGESLQVGDGVSVASLGGREGTLVEFRGDEAVVAVGALKVTVPRAAVRRSDRASTAVETPVAIRGDLPEEMAATEIDLRGLRVDEMEPVLVSAVDDAMRAGLSSLRIIHGKGTGALRERVAELLRADARVRDFRLGAWNEGGAGVTVATLG
ncbi:MAG TPA: endonuclease MutS2 [Gemmatimonadaceae bacterium]|nr:endonuclease MutS2 [Gemmatimonadaceae bacterium]